MRGITKVIIGVVAVFALIHILSIQDAYIINKYLDDQVVIVHRGDMVARPEQTMVAYQYAYDLGVRIMECDARLTADGVFVAIHDETWDRTTNGSGAVASTNWRGYGEWLDAGSWFSDDYEGEPIPTMESLIDWADDNDVLLWIDCYFVAVHDEAFIELLKDVGMDGKVVVQFVIETGAYHRADTYDGIRVAYRVAVPLLDMVRSAMDWCVSDGVQHLTIPWEMGSAFVYAEAESKNLKLSLFAYNVLKSDSEFLQEFEEGAWACFSDSAEQAATIQRMLEA